jgi:hypothetical protein
MKHHLIKLIDAAKLRNQKVPHMPEAGNEFRYFSKDASNMKINNQTQVNQESSKIVKVNYKSKL